MISQTFLSLKDGLVGHQLVDGGDIVQENLINSVLKRHKICQKPLLNSLEYVMSLIILCLRGHYNEPRGRSERVFRCLHVGFNRFFNPCFNAMFYSMF